MIPIDARALFITGAPGAGKTTLSGRIAGRTGRVLLTSHDLVELVDPSAIADGRMADESKMQRAFVRLMEYYQDEAIVMDGWPRNAVQAKLLPVGSLVIHLRVGVSEATRRMRDRGREDDTPEIIAQRLAEQLPVFDQPWIRDLAGWHRTLNTERRSAAQVEDTVMLYLTGERKEVF
jgi:adenylate kinase family enzyme